MRALRAVLMSQLTVISLLLPGSGFAGDETDYSAPYITVENGELVTKYPAKEHAAVGDAVTPASTGAEPVAEGNSRTPWIAATLIPLLAIIILLVRRRSRA